MDLASAAGIGLSLFSVVLGVIVIGLSPGQVIDIPSLFITVGGAIGGTMLGNPLELTTGAGKTLLLPLKSQKSTLKKRSIRLLALVRKQKVRSTGS